jgi:hypothetical protein
MKNGKVVAGVLIVVVVATALAVWMLRPRPGYYTDLPTFMSERYGLYDAQEKVWTVPLPSGEKAEDATAFRICSQQTVRSGDREKILLAVCGEDPAGGHAQPGSIDFFVLEKAGRDLHLLAASQDNASGSFGVPGKVAVLQLGRAFYGFRVDEVWSGQGYTFGTTFLYVPHEQTFRQALALRSLIDSTGTLGCEEDSEGEGECTAFERTLTVDDSQPQAAVWPLVVSESGFRDRRDMNAVYRIGFDKQRWLYEVPESIGLKDE